MGLELKQSLKLSHQLLMTPQLQQAIKLLQLSRHELEEEIQKEILTNPFLEQKNPNSNQEILATRELIKEKILNPAGEDSSFFDNSFNKSSLKIKNLRQEDYNYENTTQSYTTLAQHLLNQCSEISFSREELYIAEAIIGNLDGRGFFSQDLSNFCQEEGIDFFVAEGVLDCIQRFDPPGIAAKSLEESLLHQLREKRIKDPVYQVLIEKYLRELVSKNFALIAKETGMPVDKIISCLKQLSQLNPDPAGAFLTQEPIYVLPDVYVKKISGSYKVFLNDQNITGLKINTGRVDLLKIKADKPTFDYANDKIKNARFFLKSIEQRNRTILRVSQAIVDQQVKFFELGPEHLIPMVLKDVADELELHESTVSRATAQKYLQSSRGLFELKYFFSTALKSASGDISTEVVKNKIKQIIAQEDPRLPLSDIALCETLLNFGIKIARRTIAKYREELNIPPSNLRRRYS